ncbi:polysaccharide deacetylase family protein [Microbulbifer sp. THAF38]|uniref:polysaccharide deacetylase family protein n=1 Tax=Microbulbifer sp. THAF38 TaxID=2587856 RepID=UPI001269376A|nr:polysaccharide deacetylase family protein [Microbulbifer sp. THAF38]QFT54300.1 Peptidoglycan deacetylase [Microbulbifer sp. THAF38]
MIERDLQGYAGHPPDPRWPNGARIAVQFVLNIEEGAESCVLNGDDQSEAYLHELFGREPRLGERDLSVESMYEYGSRAGVWRILNIFNSHNLPLTVFACGLALELNPILAKALVAAGHELAGHGYRWLDYRHIGEEIEREHIQKTRKSIERLTGEKEIGWYIGRTSVNSRRLLGEMPDLLYSSDSYSDDLPYWSNTPNPWLIIPYTLVSNDVRYLLPNGCASSNEFFHLLKDSFDLLWQEGESQAKMLTVGLHSRISGHPARAMALIRFLDYILNHEKVWICRRADIARHWISQYPP